ncbi:MAG: prolipoprotein diacylglyceryl transferase family protein [Anaerolineales bacterium]
MLPTLRIGPLSIQTPGLLLLIGVFLGLSLAERFAARRGLPPERMYSLVFILFLSGIAGARLSFAAQHAAAFRAAPLSLLALDPALLDPFGGLATAGLAALVAGRRWRLSLWATLDAFTPALAVSAVFIGLANLASGRAFGAPTDLPWGIPLWGEVRHPTQIYQAVGSAMILAGLWKRFGRPALPGNLFLQFTALTAGLILFLEAFRGDSLLVAGGLRQTQVLAWLILAICLGLLEQRGFAPRNE